MAQVKSLANRIQALNQYWGGLGWQNLDHAACEEIIPDTVRFLPAVCACPEITAARILFNGIEYTGEAFHDSGEKLVVEIPSQNAHLGKVELHYQAQVSPDQAERVLEEDRAILEILSERLGYLAALLAKNEAVEQFKEEALTAYDRTIEAWAAAFDAQNKEASGHTERVVNLALALAEEMGFDGEDLAHIRRGALLHDIGKISVPDEIILKPGKLTEDEFDVVKRHPLVAQKWLSQIELLKPALAIPYYHHEKWDGSGYPMGLVGEDIPLVARMFSVVDVWDALISDRPFRQAMTRDEALDIIISQAGSHFDPDVVEHFIKVLSEGDYLDVPDKMRVQAFGHDRVWVQSRLVSSSEWQVRAARDLFFLFLAYPMGLTREQVGLHMWPDISTDDLEVRFKNTLYRLRRAVGKDVILLDDGRYRFNPLLAYAYDVEIFTTAIERASQAEEVPEMIKNLKLAIQQYKGDYLPESEVSWVIPSREHYRQLYMKALYELAKRYFEKEIYPSALKYCQQALVEDPYFEEAHRLAMRIHAANGSRSDIIRQYEECEQNMLSFFGVRPSEQTRELYEKLIQS